MKVCADPAVTRTWNDTSSWKMWKFDNFTQGFTQVLINFNLAPYMKLN